MSYSILTNDITITSIKIMEAYIESKLPASKLADGFYKYPQVTKNVKVADKEVVLKDKDITDAVEKAKQELGNNGRILVRKSGTEPVIRVMAEAQEESLCHKYIDTVVDLIVKKGYTV